MKKIYLLLLVFITTVSFGQTPVITTIVDGTCSGGNPKMIEIFAQGQVDFSQFTLQKQSNGGGFNTSSTFDLSVFGIVTNDYVYVYNASDEAAFLSEFPSAASKAKEKTSFASGNGDDAFRIVDANNTVIDIFGITNEDGSGKYWEYKDSYAKRNTGAPASATMIQTDWTFGGPDFLDGKCGGNTFEVEIGGIQTYYQAPAAGPYFTEGFENGGTFPGGWTLTNGTHDWAIDQGDEHGPGNAQEGDYCAYFNDYSFSSGTTADMISPNIDLSNATNPELNFWYWDSSGSDTVEILISTDGSNYTNVFTTPSTVSSWTKFTVDLSAYAGQATVNIAFRGTSVYGYSNPHVDNIIVKEAPTCLDPTGLNVDSVTDQSAILSWTDAGGNSGTYTLEYKEDGTSSWTTASTTATSPYTLSGLNPSTTYNWQLTKDCGADGSSSIVAGPDFTTECAPISTLPILEDLESATPPDLPQCYSVETTTNATWTVEDHGYHPNTATAHSGNNMLRFNAYSASSGKEAKFISPNIVLPNTIDAIILSFYIYHDTGYSTKDDRVQAQVYDGTNWIDVGNPVSRYNGSTGWSKYSVDISAYANQTVKFALNGISAYGNDIYIDDISVELVSCTPPTDIVVNPQSTTIDVSWTPGGSESGWLITWGPQGFTPDFSANTNIANVTTPSYLISGLTPAENYDIYIMSDCGSNTSNAVGPISSFTTYENNDCANAISLDIYNYGESAGNEVSQNTEFATDSGMHTSCDNVGTNNDLFYKFILPPNKTFKIITGGSEGDKIEAAIYDSCGGAELVCEGASSEKIITGLSGGQEYILQVWHDDFNAGEFTIALEFMPDPPVNNDCANARTVAVYPEGASAGNETIGNTEFATGSGITPSCANTPVKDLFYKFTLSANVTDINVITSGDTGQDLKIALYDACGGNEIVCEDADSNHIIRGLTAGNTYYLQVWHEGSNAGSFKLGIEVAPQPPVNDNCIDAIDIPVSSTGACGNPIIGNNEYANDSGVPVPSCSSTYAYGSGGDVWFTVTIPASGAVTITTSEVAGSDISDTVMAIYSGDCSNLTEVDCDDDSGDGYFSQIELTNQNPGDVFYVRVYEYGNNSFGDFGICAFDPSVQALSDQNIEGLKYYPNPVTDQLNISADSEIQAVSIFDVSGKEIIHLTPNGAKLTIDVSHLNTGVYYVKAIIDNNLTAFEIIKK